MQHYLFPAGGDGIYLVVDERGKLREENFQKALVRTAVITDGQYALYTPSPDACIAAVTL